MKQQYIDIGTKINLASLIKSRLLIQANSGGGKSVLARLIMEQSFGKVPFIIMDIDGEYYTLKELYGDILIIGGQNADIPLNVKTAKLLPKEIVGNQLSVILDLSDLEMPDRIQYAKNFLEALMQLNREYWMNYLIFIEEAHKLCGEQDKQASAGAVKDLMSRGRKRGFCGILITQRIAKLHKDAAAECNNKFIGRTFMDVDYERAYKELGFTAKSNNKDIRTLEPGTFYAFGTSIEPNSAHVVKVKMPKSKIPEAGTKMDIKPKAPTEKLKAILSKLSTQNEEPKIVKEVLPHKPQKSYEAEYRAEQKRNMELHDILKGRDIIISSVQKDVNATLKLLSKHSDIVPSSLTRMNFQTTKLPKPDSEIISKKEIAKESTITPTSLNISSLGKCAMAIVEFLNTYSPRALSKVQIGICIGYSPNSGGFNNALSELNTSGLIEREGSKIRATHAAYELLGKDYQHKQYSIDGYANKLSKCEREIYEVLLQHREYPFDKKELANHTPSQYSFDSGGFNNALSTLRTHGLIERENGQIRLNPELLQV